MPQRAAGDFDRLVTGLERQLDRLSAGALLRVEEKLSLPQTDREVAWHHLGELIRESLTVQIKLSPALATSTAPDIDAAILATLGGPQDVELFLAGARASQIVLWESWFELVEDSDLDHLRRRELLERGSDFFFRYADQLGDHLATIHRDRSTNLTETPERRRFRVLSALLEGELSSEADRAALADLDYDLDRHHLGLFAWGGEPELAVRSLSAELGRPPLCLSPPGQGATCWAWLSAARPWTSPSAGGSRPSSPSAAAWRWVLRVSGRPVFARPIARPSAPAASAAPTFPR